MEPVLVAYGTTEGQTRKIAGFIAERIRGAGHEVDLVDTASPEAANLSPVYAAAILGASLHQGRHQCAFVHFLKENRPWLAGIPVALFSVSLAVASDDAGSQEEAKGLLDELVEESGLSPVARHCIAGALRYTRYDYLKRMLMRYIAKRENRPTDTSGDYEFTDWDDVGAFVDGFLGKL